MTPNRFQRAMLDLIDATEDRITLSTFSRVIREQFAKDPERTLRDYCTVGLLLPQRAGKTALVTFLGYHDLVVFANKKAYEAHAPGLGNHTYQVAVAHYNFRDVHEMSRVRRIIVMDPFWNDTGVDKQSYYKLVNDTFGRMVVSVFLDSPFTERT